MIFLRQFSQHVSSVMSAVCFSFGFAQPQRVLTLPFFISPKYSAVVEQQVWEFFLWLQHQRVNAGKGFTNASEFLETVRFCKFTVQLCKTEDVLKSRRLLGFAAIQKSLKGPMNQAPPLEIVHLQRLHAIL